MTWPNVKLIFFFAFSSIDVKRTPLTKQSTLFIKIALKICKNKYQLRKIVFEYNQSEHKSACVRLGPRPLLTSLIKGVKMTPSFLHGFSDLKIEAFKQSKQNFSTCSPSMNTLFDVNWMTSSLIIYAKLFLQIKV